MTQLPPPVEDQISEVGYGRYASMRSRCISLSSPTSCTNSLLVLLLSYTHSLCRSTHVFARNRIPFIISGVVTPFMGGFIDWCGGRAILAAVSAVLLIMVHSTLGFSSVWPTAVSSANVGGR